MKNCQVINRAVAGTSLLQNIAVFAGATLLTSSFALATSTPITIWTFESFPATLPATQASYGPIAASTGTGNASGTHALAASVYSSPTGNGGGLSFSSNDWSVGDYYQFQTSTTGISDALTLQWDQVSSGTGPGQFELQYSTDGTSFTTFTGAITSGAGPTYTGAPYTVTSTPSFSTTTPTALDTFTTNLSSLASVLDNQANVYFRLTDFSTVAANGAAVGATGTDRIDNFIVGHAAAAIGARNLLYQGGLWNNLTTNTNWFDTVAEANTYFITGDITDFTDANVGTVNVDAGGVQPSGVNISNNSGTYTFTGGPINDDGTISTTLTKTNNGTLNLAGTNGYSGGTVISGGTLQVASNASLGAVAGLLTLSGNSTLQLTSSLNLVRPIFIGTGGANITTGGNNLTIGNNDNTGGTISGTVGNLTVTGGGTLTTYIAPNLGNGILTVQGGTLDLAVAKFAGVTFQAPASGAFTAQIIFDAALTLSVNGGFIDGAGGTIAVNADGSWIYGAGTAATTTIGDPITVNGTFTLGLGADPGDTLNVNGGISGNFTLEFLDESGIVVLKGNNQSSDTTDSSLLQTVYSSKSTSPSGIVRLGEDNALPIQPLLFGGTSGTPAKAYAVGGLDLNGYSQTLPSLGTTADGTSYSASNGITNSTNTMSTLTIDDQGQQNQTVFAGPIGALIASNITGTNAIALTLGATNTGSLTLIAPSTYTGPTTINGGTLILASGNVGYTSATPPVPVPSTGSIANSPVTIGAAGTLSITATGTSIGGLNATSPAAQLQLNGNVLTITGGGSYAGQISASGGGLAITGGTTQLAGATHTLGSLSLTTGGKLDLTNSNLVVADSGQPTATIVGYLKNGTLFTSDSVSGGALTGTTLGYIDTGTVLDIKYTWYGDLDLSGSVTNADYTAMLAGNGTSWAQGDLNYDNVKNADDWALFQLGAFVQNGSIPAGVPEPAALGLVALPMLMGMRRRRR